MADTRKHQTTNRVKFTPAARARFLKVLAETCNVTQASEAVNMTRNALYHRRDQDESFRAEWDEAVEMATDALESEARRRAFDGVRRPVYQGGRRVGYVREYSDQLMQTLLKGARPHKYRERVAVTGAGGGALVVRHAIERPEDMGEVLAVLEESGALDVPERTDRKTRRRPGGRKKGR
jgi:hypothetical protein